MGRCYSRKVDPDPPSPVTDTKDPGPMATDADKTSSDIEDGPVSRVWNRKPVVPLSAINDKNREVVPPLSGNGDKDTVDQPNTTIMTPRHNTYLIERGITPQAIQRAKQIDAVCRVIMPISYTVCIAYLLAVIPEQDK